MDKNIFRQTITTLQTYHDKLCTLHDNGIDLYMFAQEYEELIFNYVDVFYDEQGVDNILWFLYEKFNKPNEPLKAYDEHGEEIMYDVDSLYEYLEKHHTINKF